MRTLLIGLVIVVGFAPSLPGQTQTPVPTGPKVQLTFEEGGKVTLVANNATLREIMAEWTRKGGTPFVVTSGSLPSAPISLQYLHQPETEVVGSLFRSAAGVIMVPRIDGSTGASQLEGVYVLVTSSPTAATGYSAPTYNAPQQTLISSQGNPETEIQPAAPGRTGEPPAAPAAPSAPPRPAGVSGVAVPVVALPPTTTTPPPPTTTGGRGGGGGGGGR